MKTAARNHILLALTAMMTAGLALTSCGTRRDLVYFQHPETAFQNANLIDSASHEVRIKPNDNLFITVSATNPTAVEIYNRNGSGASSGSYINTSALELTGYLVDDYGEIKFPVLGKLRVAGLTKYEAEQMIADSLSRTVDNPTVDIRFVSYSITMLGEVNAPGVYKINNERISIVRAIALAGDLTLYGQRRDIQIFRTENGEKKHYVLDLTKPDVFYSPLYYLQQNDIVYVSPNSTKAQSSTNIMPVISLIMTFFSSFVTIYYFIRYSKD
jgi:polysaccharide export outer membrane protein